MIDAHTDSTDRSAAPKLTWPRLRGFLGAAAMMTAFLLLPFPERDLNALPSIDIDLLDGDTVEVTWPDTGENVQLESSGDLGSSEQWQDFPGTPNLQDGVFHLAIPVGPSGSAYFRLTEAMLDPTAPVFDDPPATNRSIFPGQRVSFTLAATDPGGLDVSFVAEPLPLPAGATLNMTTGGFSWTPSVDQIGVHVITFLAFNGSSSGRLPISFTVQQPPAGGETSLSGIVLDTTDAVAGDTRPVQGVAVSLLGTGIVDATGADGRFLLQGIPGGMQVLDLATADALPAPDGSPYAGFREAIGIVGGIDNVVERPFYLPRIAAVSLTTVDPISTTVVENPDLAITLTVAPHTAILGEDEFTGELSISEVPEGLAPAALPENLDPGLLITIQPVGVIFAEPAPISFPNIDGLAPGTETDLWSLDPQLGAFAIVGKGRVSPDGTRIDTFEGGVRAADWHMALPPDPSNGPPPDPPPPCEDDCCEGPSGPSGGASGPSGGPSGSSGGPFSKNDARESLNEGDATEDRWSGRKPPALIAVSSDHADDYIHFSSQVSPASGALRTWFQLPYHESLGVERALTFFYNSNQAYPHLLVPMNGEISVRSTVPPTVSARLQLGGVDCGIESFMATTGFSEGLDEPFRIVSAMNASALRTGVYPFSVKLSSNFIRSSVAADIGNEIAIVNRRGSAFGNGWGLAGLQQVHGDPESPVGVIVTDGSGAADRFTGSLAVLPFTVAALDSTASGDYSLADGSLFDDARAALAGLTSGSLLPVTAFAAPQIAMADVVFISPYRSATEGRALSAAEQADVMAFVQGGGCVVALLDHTLGRGSFAGAIESIAGLFQVETTDAVEPYTGPIEGDILEGFFGTVSQIDRPFGGSAITDLGPWAEGIGAEEDDGYPGAFIPADAIAPGSGPVVLLPDVQAFTDNLTYGFTTGFHEALFLNAFGACIAASLAREDSRVLRGVKGAIGFVVVDNATGAMVRRNPDGSETGFDASGIQRTMTDPDGNVTTYEYSGGNLSRIIDPAGRETALSYSGGKLASITDPAGRITQFTFDGDDLISVRFPGDATRQFGYDERSLMISETDANGGETTRIYDAFGCIVSTDIPGGIHRTLVTAAGVGLIDPSTGLGTETNPAPPTRPEDAVASFTDGAGRVKEYVFNPDGSPGGASDDFGDIARIQRDADRNPVEETGSDGRSFSRVFDRLGRLISETDNVAGGTTRYEYEGESHYPSAIIDALGRTAQVEYDERGNFTRLVSAAGLVHTAAYNARGQFTQYDDPSGASTSYEYDAQGNLLRAVSGPPGDQRVYQYTRDLAGRMASFTDSDGRAFSIDYDPMGNPSRMEFAGGRIYTYTFDGESNMTSLTPPGRGAHRLEYNAEGHPSAYIPPAIPQGDTRTTYEFDGNGQLLVVRRADGDDIVTVSDAAGRISSVATADGTTAFIYNTGADQPSRVEGPGGVDIGYQFAANMLTALAWEGEINGAVRRTYNAQGIVSRVSVDGGTGFDYEFNGDGQITRVGDYLLTLDPATGMPQSDALGALRGSWQFNRFGNVTGYSVNAGGPALYSHASSYDPAGRLTEVRETLLGVESVLTYTYDAAGRLQSASRDGTSIGTYTYDANLNRLQAVEGGTTRDAAYDAQDRLLTLGGNTYTYDLAGDLEQKSGPGGSTTYHFDAYGNLLSANLPGVNIKYLIDGAGRRVGKEVNGVLQKGFLWQDRLRVAAELDGSGNIISQFAYPGFGVTPVYMLRGGQTYAILSDFRGSPRLVVNASNGNVVQRVDYDVWGRVTNDTNPGFQPFGFGGGIYDADTGLVRLGVREYDPEAARFMTKDTEFFWADGGNLYAFTGGDPINHVDSTGLDHWFWGCVRNPNADVIRETMTPEEFREYTCRYKLGQDAIKNLAIDVATAGIPAAKISTKARNLLIQEKAKELTNQCSRGKGTGSSSNR